jgi:hypothetical protein
MAKIPGLKAPKRRTSNADGDDVNSEHRVDGISTCSYTVGIQWSQDEADRLDEYNRLFGRRV